MVKYYTVKKKMMTWLSIFFETPDSTENALYIIRAVFGKKNYLFKRKKKKENNDKIIVTICTCRL